MKPSKNLSLLLDSLLNFINSRKDIKEFCDPLPNKFEFKSVKPKSKPVKKLINKNLLQKFNLKAFFKLSNETNTQKNQQL